MVAVFKELPAFSGRHPGHQVGTVIEGKPGVARPEGTGDSLNDDLGRFFYRVWTWAIRVRMNSWWPGSVDQVDDLLGGIRHGVATDDGQAAGGQGGLARIHVIALEANHEGKAQPDFLDRVDDALGDHVAIHDPTEDIDEDALHVLVASG